MSSSPISVIIPAFGATPYLGAILHAIDRGTVRPGQIVVSHSGADNPTAWLAREHPDVRCLHSPERLFAGEARNRGAAIATGDVLAFCDSDAVPDLGWLASVERVLSDRQGLFVVGSVGVAERGGYWGMANWACEFSEQAPWRRAGGQRGGASCNMALRARDFATVGGFAGHMRAGEDTLLFERLRRAGLQQHFEPAMAVFHMNQPGFARFVRHQFLYGRHFALLRKHHETLGYRLVRWKLPVLGLGSAKAAIVLSRLIASGPPTTSRIALLPGVLLGCAIWNAGVLREILAPPANREIAGQPPPQ